MNLKAMADHLAQQINNSLPEGVEVKSLELTEASSPPQGEDAPNFNQDIAEVAVGFASLIRGMEGHQITESHIAAHDEACDLLRICFKNEYRRVWKP